MPLGKSSAHRYALKLRSACERVTRGDRSLVGIGPLTASAADDGYEFSIFASMSRKLARGPTRGPLAAIIHVSDDGYVTIDLNEPEGEEFPKPLLECIVHRAEILR